MHFDWLSILIALDLIYFPLLAVWAAWQVMKLRRGGERQSGDEMAELRQQMEALRQEFDALRQTQAEREGRLAARFERLGERMDALERRAQGGGLHVQALRLLESGMGVDELASVCNLSRGEVELLKALHAAGKEGPAGIHSEFSGTTGDSPLKR